MFSIQYINVALGLLIVQLLGVILFFKSIDHLFFDKELFGSVLNLSVRKFFQGIVIAMFMLLFISFFMLIFHFEIFNSKVEQIDIGYFAKGIFITLMIGIREEIVFRGFLFHNLRKVLGSLWAIIISSIVFTIMHINYEGFTYITFLSMFISGCFLAVLALRSGNISLSVGVHFFYDFYLIFLCGNNYTGVKSDPIIWGELLVNERLYEFVDLLLYSIPILIYLIYPSINYLNKRIR